MISNKQPGDYELYDAKETGKERNMRMKFVRVFAARQHRHVKLSYDQSYVTG